MSFRFWSSRARLLRRPWFPPPLSAVVPGRAGRLVHRAGGGRRAPGVPSPHGQVGLVTVWRADTRGSRLTIRGRLPHLEGRGDRLPVPGRGERPRVQPHHRWRTGASGGSTGQRRLLRRPRHPSLTGPHLRAWSSWPARGRPGRVTVATPVWRRPLRSWTDAGARWRTDDRHRRRPGSRSRPFHRPGLDLGPGARAGASDLPHRSGGGSLPALLTVVGASPRGGPPAARPASRRCRHGSSGVPRRGA